MFPPQVKIAKQFRGNEWHWILLILDNHEKLKPGNQTFIGMSDANQTLGDCCYPENIGAGENNLLISKMKLSSD